MTNTREHLGLTIILLDDEESILKAMSRMIKVQGHQCLTTKIGEDVLLLLRDLVPDLIILDIKIAGGLGGIETMKRIRQSGFKNPVFSMSGYPASEIFKNPDDVEGFNAHIEKPFGAKQLSELIDTHCVDLSV